MKKSFKLLLLTLLAVSLVSGVASAANSIRIACPATKTVVDGDSIPIEVHLTNDQPLGGISLGFHYNSSDVQILTVKQGTVFPAAPAFGSFLVQARPDLNKVLVGWINFTPASPLPAQTDGLLFTMYMRVPLGTAAQCVDIDSAFVPPAGSWLLSPQAGGSISPDYSDCGTADVIIGGSSCPSANTAPVVSDIPNQTINEGQSFATITLDNFVTDAQSADNLIAWTAISGSPNGFQVNIDANRVATITYPGGQFNGSATFAFKATDPGGLFATDSATFTVNAVNDPPVVSNIPDQNLPFGSTFATIPLDNYVTDPDNTDAQITWTFSGNVELTVAIDASRVATISKPDPNWHGSEVITFTAHDPGALTGSDAATFTIQAPGGVIKTNPDTLKFTGYLNGVNPVGQPVIITNIGTGSLNWNATESSAWLSITSTSGTAPSGFTANVDLSSVGVGSYKDSITVTSAQATNSPHYVIVQLNVLPAVDILLNPDSLHFYANQNGANPARQSIHISNGAPSGVEFSWGLVETTSWLVPTATSGITPADVGFDVDISGLLPGDYNAMVIFKETTVQTSVDLDQDTLTVKLTVDTPTDVDGGNGILPTSYNLKQNFPNPFNPETAIEYSLPASCHVTLTVYNILGRKVKDIVNANESAGHKRAIWDGRDGQGNEAESGIYFYRLTTDNFSMTRKMMLLK